MWEVRFPNVQVQLTGMDGNAFAVMGRVVAALRKDGQPDSVVSEFLAEAQSGDYDNVLVTCMKWVDVS